MRIHIGLVVLLGARLTQAEPFDPARALEQVTNEQLDAALVAIVRGACYRRDLGQSIEARLGWSPLPVRLGVALSFRWSEAIAADGRSILKTPAVPQAVTLSATDDTYDTRIELLERGAKDPIRLLRGAIKVRLPLRLEQTRYRCGQVGQTRKLGPVRVRLTQCDDDGFAFDQDGDRDQVLAVPLDRAGAAMILSAGSGHGVSSPGQAPRGSYAYSVQHGCGPGCEGPPQKMSGVLFARISEFMERTLPVTITRPCAN